MMDNDDRESACLYLLSTRFESLAAEQLRAMILDADQADENERARRTQYLYQDHSCGFDFILHGGTLDLHAFHLESLGYIELVRAMERDSRTIDGVAISDIAKNARWIICAEEVPVVRTPLNQALNRVCRLIASLIDDHSIGVFDFYSNRLRAIRVDDAAVFRSDKHREFIDAGIQIPLSRSALQME